MLSRIAIAVVGAAALVASAAPAALAAPKSRSASQPAKAVSSHRQARARTRERTAAPQAPPSEAVTRLLQWITITEDNGSLPYAIIDKQAATLFVFDADGQSLGAAPVLIGMAVGDESSPGVGSKVLSEIGPAEKTTPAGRFLARYGLAVGGEKVLWVDYADSVAMHAVITSNRRERRLQRLRTPSPEDNRITFGCINVPTTFYQRQVRPRFQGKGGYVYILPDSKPVEAVFPRLLTMPYLAGGGTDREMPPIPTPEPPPAD